MTESKFRFFAKKYTYADEIEASILSHLMNYSLDKCLRGVASSATGSVFHCDTSFNRFCSS